MTEIESATVVTLVAEVRVLMVASRQITLSVFRQLDEEDYDKVEPMGRVNAGEHGKWMVGRYKASGALVRAQFSSKWERFPRWHRDDQRELDRLLYKTKPRSESSPPQETASDEDLRRLEEWRADLNAHDALPLIVLAGLK